YALAMHRFVGQRSRPRSDEGLAVSREALGELRQAVQRCHDAGLLLGDRDPEDVVTHLRALAHGLAEFENLGMLGPDPEAQWLAAVSAQLDGYLRSDVVAA
ncbi:MAG TPA: WHG domain-containing protein, partial [Solirubrobacteraceae bacterium]|nr:WHG domain-containing protein [Solirubrobacteraceae bacterium]